MPTILEVAGVKAPKTVNGIAQKLIEDVSMAYPFDIGADTGPPVDDADYQVPFPLTGRLAEVTLKIERPKLTPADGKLLMQERRRNNRASE